MSIRKKLRSILWRVPVEREVDDEISHHVALRAEDFIAAGMEPAAARAEAVRRFGNVDVMRRELTTLGRERNRQFGRQEWGSELLQDLRFAWRQSVGHPGFAIAAILTLALGLGATTAIFSVVHAVVLKPFPYPNPDEVLLTYTTFRGQPGNVSVGNYDYIRRRTTTLEHLAAWLGTSFNLAEGGEPERVPGALATWSYFSVFRVPPLYGRTFTAEEDRPGAPPVVVLSQKLWERRFGADPGVVGRNLRMSGVVYDVIGIMPASFDEIGGGEELWIPIAFRPEQLAMYDEHFLTLVGRRLSTVTLAQVNDELARVAEGLVRDHPETNRNRGAGAGVLGSFVVGNYRTRLFVLLAAVGLVLLIACANVANLLLARLAARSRELAIRAAIGAGGGRIVRQVLTESLFLVVVGGLAGLIVAWWAIPILVSLAPASVPRLNTARLDAQVLAVATALVLFSTVIVGLLPAWQAVRRANLRDDLGDGRGAATGALRAHVRQLLIAGQAALVLVVLSAAALLVRSAINLQQVELGFETSSVLTARVALPASQYPTPLTAREAFLRMLEHASTAPGVTAAALDSQPPLISVGSTNGLMPEGRPLTEDRINSQSHFISPDYFSLLNIPLKAGRTFTDADIREAPLVMIVNETLARDAFGATDPVGRRIACCEGSPDDPRLKTVVGVVADVRGFGPAQAVRPEFYLPLRQIPDEAWRWIGRSLHVLARGDDPMALTTAIRAAVRQVDPALPVFAIRTMDEGRRQVMAQARFNTLLMTLLGATGLVLAALGIYSVIAWLVAQRTREIGVRMALGASVRDVVSMMALHGLKPVVAGLLFGVIGAMATTTWLQAELFEVEPRDPFLLAITALLLLVVGAAAAVVPAWRAARIDPSRALHE